MSEAQKRAAKKYRQSKKGKATDARYDLSEKGGARYVQYNQSEKSKMTRTRYNLSGEGKARDIRYRQSEKGKIANARVKARRKRSLDFKPMNSWFPGCNGHHIDKINILFIPEKLHRSIKHSQNDSVSMKAINITAFEWLCTQEII